MAIVGIQETDKDNDSYEIQWGDTLGQIAVNNNTTVEALTQLNGIKDPDRIRAGGTLIIPTQPRRKEEATLPPQQAARQVAFEEAAQKYAAAPKEEPVRKEERKPQTILQKGKAIVGSLLAGKETAYHRERAKDRSELSPEEFHEKWVASPWDDEEEPTQEKKPTGGGNIGLLLNQTEKPSEEDETSWEKRHGFASPEVEAASLLSREEDKKELSSTVIPSPIKYVWGSLWGKGTGQTRTGADVGEDVVQVTKDAKDNAIAAGRSHVHYEDYGETNRGLPVAALVGAAKDASGRKLSPKERQSLSSQRRKAYPKNPIGAARLVYDLFTDPKVKAALTIGGFSIRGDEGSEYLEDVFNFNTANSGDKDWYAFIRKVLSNSGLMPIDDKEGIKTRIELG
jgi:LysM repeat protein